MPKEMLNEEIMEEFEAEEMEEELMEESKFAKVKSFGKKHGKKILVGLGAVALAVAGYALGKKNGNKSESGSDCDLCVIDLNDSVDEDVTTE